MRIAIPAAPPEERLVAATPDTVERLVALGYEVVLEAGAGERASLADLDYEAASATLVSRADAWGADIVTAVAAPGAAEIALMRPGAILIAPLAPHSEPALLEQVRAAGVTALALDAVPRISRAQALDVLSTRSNVSGYRAVIEAAEAYGGMFAGQVTAAGKTNPATVFVIGGGVAGLAAIGAAVSLGSRVRAFDVRPEAAEQIESMGASFVVAPEAQQDVSPDGYASPLTEEQQTAAMALYAREAAEADVVITTALVRGAAPTTLTSETVAQMRAGAVIVDLAAAGGGNCEATVVGERAVTANGVTVIGYTDLPGRMPRHTSQLVGTNVVNLMKLMTPAKDGEAVLDLEDDVIRGMTVAHEMALLWPPPPITVSAAPTAAATPTAIPTATPDDTATLNPATASATATDPSPGAKGRGRLVAMVASAALLGVALAFADAAFLAAFTVFALAVVIGYYVISNVSHSLHTPLMSQTNAISGIILIGAMLQLGSADPVVTTLAFLAAAIASINVFGGFLVTYRMLGMFSKGA
ncbi:Re/Si-specific NAD(P)(+) transhydrogenase subunit alpha [Demequina sp. NBRC 110055]|uniref:Re/Si-specific NAD(P)(+) transhydrogenase subunit alpha n=1 Tax=Demequina sp. NBRC 110055 TaxID=1570344 RepID=UPI0009FE8CD9|nr:Re/Si-specific NAD(P)(+) transhydrogenase subunit alpha [Demequina sp. NBRC 110055]